eukprot:332161-Pleurochrysis_carterae.AAC.1
MHARARSRPFPWKKVRVRLHVLGGDSPVSSAPCRVPHYHKRHARLHRQSCTRAGESAKLHACACVETRGNERWDSRVGEASGGGDWGWEWLCEHRAPGENLWWMAWTSHSSRTQMIIPPKKQTVVMPA